MGLLLSVLAVCVGVIELLACYRNVMRAPAIYQDGPQLARIAQGYLRDLNRERLRLLSELGEEDNRLDLTAAAYGHYIDDAKSKEFNNNHQKTIYSISEFPALQIRKASLEESLCKEDIVHHMADGDVPQQSSLLTIVCHRKEDDHVTNRNEEIYGNREGSPFPTTCDLLAPRKRPSIDSSVLEVDEADIDRKSNSPTTQKIDMILQESNFDSKDFWANKNAVGQKKKGSTTVKERSPPPLAADGDRVASPLETHLLVDEDDSVLPDFDTSVLQRIDGVSAKPRTPSEERKLKLKKKRNSKSFKEPISPAIDSDSSNPEGNLSGPSLTPLESPSTSQAAQEPFWLIFSGEFTKAMNKDWHGQHFCCWKCDESLTGQRYVLRDDHPYCVACYESQFANGCEKCNKTIGIDSKDLSYKDKHWHEACFLCTNCGLSLVDKQFGSKSDRIYCGGCYDEKFASRCDGCSQIFRAGTKKMEYKTRQWHEQCFCCVTCKTPIGTQSFIPRDSEIYCAKCYEEKYATRCIKCNKVITSGGVTYKNEPWHRECFTCTHCDSSLAGARFTSRDDKPYCANCFGDLFAKRCYACSKPITGIGGTKFISFEERHWHNDCFYCAHCHVSLVGRGFITDQNDIICPDCAKQKLM